MKRFLLFIPCALFAAAFAPLIIPPTGGLVFFVLHQWLEPSEWGLPTFDSILGVSTNVTIVGYVFTWFFGLPIALILRFFNQDRLAFLLIAGAIPSVTLPFWQASWKMTFVPVLIAGISTAYIFWLLTNFAVRQIEKLTILR